MNFQYICIVTPFSVTGTGVLTNYYASKSDFIDESACIGLIKKTRTLYKGISFEEYINGENANTTFSSQGYPLIYSDLGWGTATATSWDSLGRPLTTSSRVDPYCSAYVKYSYDDSILKNFGDLVKSGDCPYWIYSPNERIFNQDYNEIQRNTFVQGISGIVTFTKNITINSTAEICK
jgi:hypothetical protein